MPPKPCKGSESRAATRSPDEGRTLKKTSPGGATCVKTSGVPRGPGLRFFLPSELSTIGLSSLARKSLRRAGVLG